MSDYQPLMGFAVEKYSTSEEFVKLLKSSTFISENGPLETRLPNVGEIFEATTPEVVSVNELKNATSIVRYGDQKIYVPSIWIMTCGPVFDE